VHRSLLIAAIRIVVQLALVGVVLTTLFSYYVSGSLITKGRTDDSAGLRIPAAEIEQLVSDRVHR
jgi:hypothetical protein